jgi:hypothetical protein
LNTEWVEGIPCLSYEQRECSDDLFYNFIENNHYENDCSPLCPLECEKVTFSKTISYQPYLVSDKNKNRAAVYVYYEHLQTTEIDESAVMDVVTLIANLGGIAGLFLGVSFLSFIEIISVLFEIIHILKIKQ